MTRSTAFTGNRFPNTIVEALANLIASPFPKGDRIEFAPTVKILPVSRGNDGERLSPRSPSELFMIIRRAR